MKKLVLSLAMVAALVSCSTDEIVDVSREAITFDDTFVDNATRVAIDGSYTTSTLEEFEVYGTISNTTGTANIFNQERVVKGNSLGQGVNWSYDEANTQYWIPGNTYNFRAIAEGNVAGVTEVVAPESDKYMATAINLLDASAQKDILFAQDMNVAYTSGSKTISFTFAHILSKVKFTFKNTIATDNGYGYKVTNVVINGTAKNGVYTIGASEPWSAAATPETYNLAFGNGAAVADAAGAEATEIAYNSSVESNWERLLIPSNEVRNIAFTTQLLKDGVVIDTQNRTLAPTIKLVPGQAYNFVVSLGNPGEPIKFDVTEVTGWVNQPETNAGSLGL